MMMQKLLLVLIPLFSTFITGDNLIEWSASRKLTWNDFKGSPDPNSAMIALTNSNIKIELGFNEKTFEYSIRCGFHTEKSWVKMKTDYILNHEQRHFDITEIYARILEKSLKAYKFNGKTVEKDINKIYSDVMKDHVASQHTYDLETNHSIDSVQQHNWDNKIDSLLNVYKDYSDYK
ncbi:MAG: DUF922 domain-containing protein [Chitinophagaceae bacterium]|nr:DUF922 domain-containing protein [Chitinophagaceae bacterium]